MSTTTKLTTRVQAGLLEGVALGLPLEAAAARVGVSRETVYRWLRAGRASRGPLQTALADGLEKARAKAKAAHLGKIRTAAEGTPGDVPCPACGHVVRVLSVLPDWRAAQVLLDRLEQVEQTDAADIGRGDIETDREGFLRRHLLELERGAEMARAAGSTQAYAALMRQVRDTFGELAALREGTTDALTREEYLAELEAAVAEWPEDAFDVVFRAYGELRRCRVLRIMEGVEEAG